MFQGFLDSRRRLYFALNVFINSCKSIETKKLYNGLFKKDLEVKFVKDFLQNEIKRVYERFIR